MFSRQFFLPKSVSPWKFPFISICICKSTLINSFLDQRSSDKNSTSVTVQQINNCLFNKSPISRMNSCKTLTLFWLVCRAVATLKKMQQSFLHKEAAIEQTSVDSRGLTPDRSRKFGRLRRLDRGVPHSASISPITSGRICYTVYIVYTIYIRIANVHRMSDRWK